MCTFMFCMFRLQRDPKMILFGLLFSILFNLSLQQTGCGEAPAECWTDMARKLCEAVNQPTTTVVGRSLNTSKVTIKSIEIKN